MGYRDNRILIKKCKHQILDKIYKTKSTTADTEKLQLTLN